MTAHAKVITRPDAAEIERRRAALDQARASCALEGIYITDEQRMDEEQLITGQMTEAEYLAHITKKLGGQAPR